MDRTRQDINGEGSDRIGLKQKWMADERNGDGVDGNDNETKRTRADGIGIDKLRMGFESRQIETKENGTNEQRYEMDLSCAKEIRK